MTLLPSKKIFTQLSAWIFWLLPLAGFPLAFARLTGKKIPLFGMVQFVSFPVLALISLAIIALNFNRLKTFLQQSAILRLTAIAGGCVAVAGIIQQFLYGGSSDHLWHAFFYASTPLAAAAIAPELRKIMPDAAALTAGLLLLSGIFSENFTGLIGNWNWNQILLFAMLPGFFVRFKSSGSIKYTLLTIFFLLMLGSLLYPEQLSVSLVIILPLTAVGMAAWNRFPERLRPALAVILFSLLLTAVCGTAMWKNTANISDSRIQLFASTAELLKNHWFIGVGPGRFFDFIQKYITPEYFLAPFSAPHHPHPHNELLHLWSAFGFAGIFFIAVLFCGVLKSFPRRHVTLRNLLPVWIFLLIFFCGQTDLTAAIISGAFWMLAAAGITLAPRKKVPAAPERTGYIAAILLLMTAAAMAIINLRTTLPLRQGRLAALKGDAATAIGYYQRSIAVKPTTEALYGCAEIALHSKQDYRSALYFLDKLNRELGIYNYLHSNRIKAVSLVNIGSLPEALGFIRQELQAYPLSVINHKLHWDLLKLLRRPQPEIEEAFKNYVRSCQLRRISPARGAQFPMNEDDSPLPSSGHQQLSYPRLLPGIIQELAAAITLFFAVLGTGAFLCRSIRSNIMLETAIGIAGCAAAGALLKPAYIPFLLLIPALYGIYYNFDRFCRNWKLILCFILLTLFMLSNALLPPNSWDEQVYQTALLKNYVVNGFWHKIADNPYSAYPSLVHAFLLCGFDWGGATLPRLTSLLLYVLTGISLFRFLSLRTGKFVAASVVFALMLSPLSLLLVRNFYVEPFILLFAIAGTAILTGENPPDKKECFFAGCAAGAAVAVKLTGAGVSLAILVLLLFRQRNWRHLLCFAFGGLIPVILFFSRIWYFYGNPFYPYASEWFGAPETACLVEQFHRTLGGHYGLDAVKGTLFGWLFNSLKPELYDGVSGGFQFPVFFVAAFAGAYLAGKQNKEMRCIWFGAAAALLTAYLFWGVTARQSRFIYPVFFGAAFLAILSAGSLSPLYKKTIAVLALVASVISLMNSNGLLMHYYFSLRMLSGARKMPAGFAAIRENGYTRLLNLVNTLPKNARIAMLTERRSLYMPRAVTILMPHFQEKLTPVPDDAQEVFRELAKFDYLIIRIPSSDVDRAPEYDDELNKLYVHIHQLLREGKLETLPDPEITILRVATSAAGNALSSSKASSDSRFKAEAALRNAEGNPRPRR